MNVCCGKEEIVVELAHTHGQERGSTEGLGEFLLIYAAIKVVSF